MLSIIYVNSVVSHDIMSCGELGDIRYEYIIYGKRDIRWGLDGYLMDVNIYIYIYPELTSTDYPFQSGKRAWPL